MWQATVKHVKEREGVYIDVTLKWLDRRKGIQNKIGSYLEVKQEIINTLHC